MQDLSAFNLDLVGLTVRSVTVDGRAATWSRAGDELTITPRRGLRDGSRFLAVVTYDGVPQSVGEPDAPFGFVHTDDGTKVAGEPDVGPRRVLRDVALHAGEAAGAGVSRA